MEIWLDTCDPQAIAAACSFGIVYGITTNPSILAGTHEDPEKVINNLLDLQDGPIAIQVTANNSQEMIRQAKALHSFSDRIIIKVPVTQQGLITIKTLSSEEISTMATAVFQPTQALLAALAGADYVAPYLGRMFDAGIDAYASLQSMVNIYRQQGLKTRILAAAIKSTDQIIACAEMGITAVTLKNALFGQLLADDAYTLDSLKTFAEDWESRKFQSTSNIVL